MRDSHRQPAPAALVIAALAMSGCAGPAVVEAEPKPRPSHALTDPFVVFENDRGLSDAVHVERVVRDPRAVPIVVQFDLVNTTDSPQRFMYKCRWFDQHAMVVTNPNEVWHRQTLLG